MMTRKRSIGLAAILLCIVAAGLILTERNKDLPASKVPPRSFWAGTEEGMMYDFSSKTALGYTATSEQRASLVQDFKGVLNVKTLVREPGGTVLAMQFSPLELSYTNDGTTLPADPTAVAAMQQMFLVTANERGGFESFEMPPDVPANLSMILEGAVRSMQVILPGSGGEEKDGSASWTASEIDANGECAAGYSYRDGRIRKRRISYAPGDASTSMPDAKIAIRSSDIRGTIDDAWVVSLDGYEQSEYFSGGSLLASGENSFKAERLPFEPNASARIWGETRTPKQIRDWFAIQKNRLDLERKMASRITPGPGAISGGMYEMELRRRLTPELATNRDLLRELTAFLRDNPEAAALLPDLLLQSGDDAIDNHAILALQTAGTPACQSALCAIMDDGRHKRMNRLRATVAFSFVENPTDASIQALRKIADAPDMDADYTSTATLALGGSAGKVRENDPARYPALADDLRKRLGEAAKDGNAEDRRLMLLSIANTHDGSFAPEIAPYLSGDDSMLREVAAGAMANMRAPEIPGLLRTSAAGDPDIRVRRTAAASLAQQPSDPETVNYVAKTVANEQDAAVQTEMARYLGRSAKTDPAAREALENLWETSGNRDVLRIVRDVRRGRVP